jgi:uncharacterized protein (TIGR00369 family)
MTMMKTMNQKLVSSGKGAAIVESMPAPQFENSMKRMHGGFVATLIDSAMGFAIHSKVPDGTQFGTIDLNVKFVRKIDMDTGKLFAKANVIHAGRTMLTAEARVEDESGKLYAHGSGSFLVYPKQ